MDRTITRLADALKAAGIPVLSVSDTEPVDIVYEPEATLGQRQQGDRIRDQFDWSEDAEARDRGQRRAAAAKRALADDTNDVWKAIRALESALLDLHNRIAPANDRIAPGLLRKALNDYIDGDQAFPDVRDAADS